MENHHAINGKIHYFYSHFPLQTVSSPEGIFIIAGCSELYPHDYISKLDQVGYMSQEYQDEYRINIPSPHPNWIMFLINPYRCVGNWWLIPTQSNFMGT